MKKFMKEVFGYVLMLIIALLAVIEIMIEVVFQLVRGIRRGYKKLTIIILKKATAMYREKSKVYYFVSRKTEDDIKIIEFDYEDEESN